jgi:hypothetical protein
VCISHISHASYMLRTCHPPWFDHPNDFCEVLKLWSSSFCSHIQPPATSSLLGPNILLSTLFSNTLNLCSSLGVRVQVSHTYKTARKIIVFFYFLIFKSCRGNEKTGASEQNGS